MSTLTGIQLDHPRLASTEMKFANPGELDPAWEIAATTTSGDRLHFDGTSGAHLAVTLDDLLDQPTTIASVDLTLWVER